MRRLLIAAALLCAAPSYAELMLKSGDGSKELRLYESSCSHGETLGFIPKEYHDRFKNARILDSKATIVAYGCWAEVEGTVLIVFEDGSHTAFELSKFKESTI